MNRLTVAARIAFGLIFMAASAHKIMEPQAFAADIFNYRLFPDLLVNPLALYLPWLELLAGACLVLGRPSRLSLGAAALCCGLMAAFMAALAFNWARGLDVACGCFISGSQEKGNMGLALLRDAAFMAIGLLALRGEAASAAEKP